MIRDLWINYLSDPDFFIPCMFVCMGISIVLKLYHWNKTPHWTIITTSVLLDLLSLWIVGVCFVSAYIWLICWPALPMGVWGAVPYTVFCVCYAFRRRKTKKTVESDTLSEVDEATLEHVHRKLGEFINSLRYVPKEEDLYWDLMKFQDKILDEEMRRVTNSSNAPGAKENDG